MIPAGLAAGIDRRRNFQFTNALPVSRSILSSILSRFSTSRIVGKPRIDAFAKATFEPFLFSETDSLLISNILNGPTGLVVPVAVFCVLQKAGGSIPALPPRGLHVDITNFSPLVLPVGSICLDFVKGWWSHDISVACRLGEYGRPRPQSLGLRTVPINLRVYGRVRRVITRTVGPFSTSIHGRRIYGRMPSEFYVKMPSTA